MRGMEGSDRQAVVVVVALSLLLLLVLPLLHSEARCSTFSRSSSEASARSRQC